MSILYKNARNVRFVLFRKNSNELAYRIQRKQLPPLPLDKRLQPLPDNKRFLPIPENRKPSNEGFEPDKRLPPLPWNKRGNVGFAMRERKEYLTKVEEL